jgi:hypothetical protein
VRFSSCGLLGCEAGVILGYLEEEKWLTREVGHSALCLLEREHTPGAEALFFLLPMRPQG